MAKSNRPSLDIGKKEVRSKEATWQANGGWKLGREARATSCLAYTNQQKGRTSVRAVPRTHIRTFSTMSCVQDLGSVTLPAEGESVAEFLARCTPSTTSASLGVGAVAPGFRRSPAELVEAAREFGWMDGWWFHKDFA